MNNSRNTNAAATNVDYLVLRRTLGILGIALPIVLVMGNSFVMQESISHFYYTKMSVVFTGTLIAFGLFLLSYRGYDKKDSELISDNIITNIAGVMAFFVALVPTACAECSLEVPNGHDNVVKNSIHLISAGLFIVIMGYMSFSQFTKSDKTDSLTKKRNRLFRICGVVIWLAVLALIIKFSIDFNVFANYIFWCETVALIAFGIAWLVKGKTLTRLGM